MESYMIFKIVVFYACRRQNWHWSHKKRDGRALILKIFARRVSVFYTRIDTSCDVIMKVALTVYIGMSAPGLSIHLDHLTQRTWNSGGSGVWVGLLLLCYHFVQLTMFLDMNGLTELMATLCISTRQRTINRETLYRPTPLQSVPPSRRPRTFLRFSIPRPPPGPRTVLRSNISHFNQYEFRVYPNPVGWNRKSRFPGNGDWKNCLLMA